MILIVVVVRWVVLRDRLHEMKSGIAELQRRIDCRPVVAELPQESQPQLVPAEPVVVRLRQ